MKIGIFVLAVAITHFGAGSLILAQDPGFAAAQAAAQANQAMMQAAAQAQMDAQTAQATLMMQQSMNAANEAAVALFLEHKIPYLEIMRRVERVMNKHTPAPPTLPNILEADAWARRSVTEDGSII